MMEYMPDDILEHICAMLEFDDMERLGQVCKYLRHSAQRYHAVAIIQWGHIFWRDAMRRPCFRTFESMRDELRHIHVLHKKCDRMDTPRWNKNMFALHWEEEAKLYRKKLKQRSIHLHVLSEMSTLDKS